MIDCVVLNRNEVILSDLKILVKARIVSNNGNPNKVYLIRSQIIDD